MDQVVADVADMNVADDVDLMMVVFLCWETHSCFSCVHEHW